MKKLVAFVVRCMGIILFISFSAGNAAAAEAISPAARAALAGVVPPGYQTAAVIPCAIGGHGSSRFVAALVDTEANAPQKSVRLLYLAWNGRWTVLDSVDIAGRDATFAPQYLSGISVVTVGVADLLYVNTTWSGGGSGSLHYFQFLQAVGGHLKLVRGFEHDRMSRGLLSLHNDRIYDAAVACTRGEKKGKAYVYACHLDTKEYTYDGEHIVVARSERLEERTGNRFLDETYWNLSLRSLLQRGGHFPPAE